MSEQVGSRREFWKRFAKSISILKPIFDLLFSIEARVAEAWVFSAHHRLYLAQWGLPPAPEFYKHKLDLYWMWKATRNSLWVERGVYSMVAIRPGAKILELCCGDGFNTYFFYSKKASEIIAVDFDPLAVGYAKRNFKSPNLSYRIADIRTGMPAGDFDNIVWDAAIEHFTEDEIANVMRSIKQRLTAKTGTLSGYTIVERQDGRKHLEHHEYEFKSKDDLARFLRPHFKNVKVFETIFPERHNLYFWASDGMIPFMNGWDLATN